MPTHYQLLNVASDADTAAIRAAYKALIKRHHPDARGGDPGMASQLNEAYRVLGNARRRADYDRQIVQRARVHRPPYQPGSASQGGDYFHFGKAPSGAEERRSFVARGIEPGRDGFLGQHKRNRPAMALAIGCAMLPFALIAWMSGRTGPVPVSEPSVSVPAMPRAGPARAPEEAVSARAQLVGGERPRTGVISAAEGVPRVAPLRVTGSPGADYYLKMVDEAGREVLTLFVRGGHTLDARAPAGRYRLRYASGNQWLGTNVLFGTQTRFAAANNVFDFGGDGRPLTAYDITLLSQGERSAEGRPIRREDF